MGGRTPRWSNPALQWFRRPPQCLQGRHFSNTRPELGVWGEIGHTSDNRYIGDTPLYQRNLRHVHQEFSVHGNIPERCSGRAYGTLHLCRAQFANILQHLTARNIGAVDRLHKFVEYELRNLIIDPREALKRSRSGPDTMEEVFIIPTTCYGLKRAGYPSRTNAKPINR